MGKSFLIFLFFVFSFDCYSQQVQNVDFTVKDDFIIVTYDLSGCPSKELYDIKLKVISDYNMIDPISVTGDIKRVSCGNDKRMVWNVLNDKAELKGKIQIELEISHTYSTKIVGGPSNAFLSMLLPGLGDVFVNKTSKSWYYTSLFYLGAGYYAYLYKVQSDKFYNVYYNATNQYEKEAAYKSANDNYQRFQIFLGVAGVIWLADVIHVTVRGSKNRRIQLDSYTLNRPKVNLYFAGSPKNFQICLVKKF
ncbi:MAG: hypothetical protein WCM93_11185 [Bacteroidota bacterium]